MEINLGNIVGLVRSATPPLEADNVTEKRYILWAQPLPADPTQYKVLYYDTNIGAWVGFDDLISTINSGLTGVMNIIGDINGLNTVDKSNLVVAINSVLASIGNFINDTTPSATETYSSNKIEQLITTVLDTVLGNVSGPYNTLEKIESIIENLDITGIVKFSEAQTLSAPQKVQANSNIGSVSVVDLGNLGTDFSTMFDDILN